MTLLEVLIVIANSSLTLAVLGGGVFGGIVVGFVVDHGRRVG